MCNSSLSPRIVVVGSINMDLVLRCTQFPKPGETLVALAYDEVAGGKGANQAVSAARAGAQVSMIGRVGDDAFGNRLVDQLKQQQVNCQCVLVTPDSASGLAMITVDQAGQNSIVIVEGANGRLTADDVRGLQQVIREADAVLLQLEIPLVTVLEVSRIARESGVRVILDPAPAPQQFPSELLQVDLICPNEHEAEQLTGIVVDSPEHALAAAQALHRQGARQVVITLGGNGAYLFDEQGGRGIPAFETSAVDTTAAGDAFIGAVVVHWVQTGNLDDAILFGNAAGSIAASRQGAQPSMASRTEIERLWGSLT